MTRNKLREPFLDHNFWRNCVFCGERPKKRTKEHIIPKWLQKFAGNEHVPAFIPTPNGTKREYWSNLVVPACSKCNNFYADLENANKSIFSCIEKNRISGLGLRVLQDWIDKIRVGFWLLCLNRGRSAHSIKPNFTIQSRMANSDRLIRIFKWNTKAQGIAPLIGYPPIFFNMPSVFTLVIKDIVILSVSGGGILQEAMGLARFGGIASSDAIAGHIGYSFPTNDFNRNWHYEYFRFFDQRFFEFKLLNDDGFNFETSTLYTDTAGVLEKINDHDIFGIRVYADPDQILNLKIKIELLELQRRLANLYSRFDTKAEFRKQLKQQVLMVEGMLNALLDEHDRSALVPLPRRSFLHWT